MLLASRMSDETEDEVPETPVVADVVTRTALRVAKDARFRPSRGGRIVGGIIAFFSIWQLLNPGGSIGAIVGIAGLVDAALWFIPCPRYIRFAATAALAVGVVVAVAAQPGPPHLPAP